MKCFLSHIHNIQLKTIVIKLLFSLSINLLYSQDTISTLSSLPSKPYSNFEVSTESSVLYIANLTSFYVKDNSLHIQDGAEPIKTTIDEINKIVKKKLLPKTNNYKSNNYNYKKRINNAKPKVLVKSFPKSNNPFSPLNTNLNGKAFVIIVSTNNNNKKELTYTQLALSFYDYDVKSRYNLIISHNKNLNYRNHILTLFSRFKHNIKARPPTAC